ncbi:MAG: P1 family peptidase [Chloroflexota bacterium]|nr:P1 family peptidase [Chloroflexota bacterium]
MIHPASSEPRARARDLGIVFGPLPTGPENAITDVDGVLIGQTTLISGEGPLIVGEGPVRTGVTVIRPHTGDLGLDPVFAGYHVLNGNGEMTGTIWIEESGLLTSPIAITNTHSVGTVRDAIIAYGAGRGPLGGIWWSLPVVAETYDGGLNDINGQHVKPEHVYQAMDSAAGGPVAEGNVGGGTGMRCHGFKGGIGTSSRLVNTAGGVWMVGVLVQANHGERRHFRVNGLPVGLLITEEEIPARIEPADPSGSGSIIIVVATDAPLLPHQCRRLAQRATIGLARAGGNGADSSGDIFLAFSTANRPGGASDGPVAVSMLPNAAMTPLFAAVADATEEAILNALCMATTMTGINGRVAHALPLDRLRQIMARFAAM